MTLMNFLINLQKQIPNFIVNQKISLQKCSLFSFIDLKWSSSWKSLLFITFFNAKLLPKFKYLLK